MQIIVYNDYQHMSQHVANELITLLKEKPDAVICLASGDTPRLGYQLLVKQAKEENVDCSKFTLIGLDEWVGITGDNDGSCRYFFDTILIEPLKLSKEQCYLFDALATNLAEECAKMDNIITAKGGIDLMIVGVGMNGHIGFNEPGVAFDKFSHVIDLDETTTTVGQKYFTTTTKLNKGITLGLQHLMNSRKAIMIANGTKKATIIKKALEGEVTNELPASIMQTHPEGYIVIDQEAASLLI